MNTVLLGRKANCSERLPKYSHVVVDLRSRSKGASLKDGGGAEAQAGGGTRAVGGRGVAPTQNARATVRCCSPRGQHHPEAGKMPAVPPPAELFHQCLHAGAMGRGCLSLLSMGLLQHGGNTARWRRGGGRFARQQALDGAAGFQSLHACLAPVPTCPEPQEPSHSLAFREGLKESPSGRRRAERPFPLELHGAGSEWRA